MNREQALAVAREALLDIVPDADVDHLGPEERFRDSLELDSLDFLALVETLTERTGCRIDEDDYPNLTTLADTVAFLTTHTA